jgi:hypothetical protein
VADGELPEGLEFNESYMKLPCGCQMWTDVIDGNNIFMFEPHALDCEYYLYAVNEAERMGKLGPTIDLS